MAAPLSPTPPSSPPPHAASSVAAPPAAVRQLLATRFTRRVGGLLASLGSSRSAVAASLEAAGVRAVPRNRECSPISLYVTAVIGADPNVKSVSVVGDAVAVDLRAWWRPVVTVTLPPAVHDFIEAFDASCYPALLPGEHRPRKADMARGAAGAQGAVQGAQDAAAGAQSAADTSAGTSDDAHADRAD